MKIIKYMQINLIKILFIFSLLASFSANSDQLDSRLPKLFDELYLSEESIDINLITKKIWDIWHETNNIKIEVYFSKGMELMSNDDLLTSVLFFTKVIKEKPDFAEAWNKRATVYFMMGEYDKSMNDIKKTLILEPRHFGALDGMALIFLHSKQYNEAIKIYDQMRIISIAEIIGL